MTFINKNNVLVAENLNVISFCDFRNFHWKIHNSFQDSLKFYQNAKEIGGFTCVFTHCVKRLDDQDQYKDRNWRNTS